MQSQLLMTRHISLSSLVFEHITVLFLNDNQCLIDCFNFICRFSNQTDWNENDINDIWTSEGWPFKMLLQGKDWGLRIGHLSPKRVWSLSPKRYIFYITKEKLNPLFWLLPDASKCYFWLLICTRHKAEWYHSLTMLDCPCIAMNHAPSVSSSNRLSC